jgi:hypothetical protein
MALVGKSLDAATGNATGSTVAFDTPKATVGMQVEWSGFTYFSVALEGSIDGVNFHSLVGTDSNGVPAGGFVSYSGVPVLYARAKIYYASGTGTLTATIAAEA